MKVPMIDLAPQYQGIEAELLASFERVLRSRKFILGPEVEQLEAEVAALCGVKHGIGVSNGSDAIVTTLIALGIGPGDEVIIPTFTFFATAGSVWRVGARPVFVDIEPDTFNIDPQAVADAMTERTKAVIPVHLYGQWADMERLCAVVRNTDAVIVEDAAQAIGATWQGHGVGSMGAAATFSFYPTKNLSAVGEAGMVVTNDDDLAHRLRCVRNHGQTQQYLHELVGGNFRMDGLQAAALRVKLPHLAEWTAMRRRCAARYDEVLAGSGVTVPTVRPGCEHVYHQYTVRSANRDGLRAHLNDAGIGSAIFYPVPLHLQPCFKSLGHKEGDFPVAEQASREVLSLPVFSGITPEQTEAVIEAVRSFAP